MNISEWKRWLEVMGRFYAIPGNQLQPETNYRIEFFNHKLAMSTGPNFLTDLVQVEGLDWDVVSLPFFQGNEDTGSQMNAPYYVVPATSRHRDEA